MRIFYAAAATPGGPLLPASKIWRDNLFGGLTSLGHEVTEFHYDRLLETFANLDPSDPRQRAFIEENRPRLSACLIDQVERAHRAQPVAVFFSYFYSACVTPEVIQEIRRMGIVAVNWYCNASYQFHLVEEIAPAFDYCLVPERYRLEDYRRVGARPVYCQEAADPRRYHPYDVPEDLDVVFVGQRYGERPALLARLHAAGLRAHAFGPFWSDTAAQRPAFRDFVRSVLVHPRHAIRERSRRAGSRPDAIPPGFGHGPVTDDEMVRLFSRGRVTLGFGGCGDTHLGGERLYQVRLRDFEAPMAGACYLAEYSDEYSAFFEPDVEVAMYRTPEELIEKARRLLADSEWRRRLRSCGRARAIAEHTWSRRLSDAFREMGLQA